MADSPKPRRILLGITGGIAAYKAAVLCRLLVKRGMDVQVVMTAAAQRFVAAATLQALSGKPVESDLWSDRTPNGMGHIDLSRDRDLIVVAPASADFLARLAGGRADDLLSTLCLARACPLAVAPAMNWQMWDNPATGRNVAQLRADGVQILGPDSGVQACGETGEGRMLEPEDILRQVESRLGPGPLAGRRVLLTAGPTFEAIDVVRGITNRSSGRMGYALAQAAREAGAEVTLVSGPVALAPPPGTLLVPVESAAQMLAAVEAHVARCHVFIGVAAVADYRPTQICKQKLKKSTQTLTLELEPTEDILATLSTRPGAPFCVGFAAESQDLERYAEEKRRRKQLPLLAANAAETAIGAQDNALILFDDAGRHPLPRGPKLEQARLLIAHMIPLLERWERSGAHTHQEPNLQ